MWLEIQFDEQNVVSQQIYKIMEYTSPEEVAVCNLASLALPRFVIDGKFDHQKLYEVTYQVTKNLNKIIDNNYYPIEEARTSNMKHRPIGLGVQGLADVFILLRLPFESDLAKLLNKNIFETIYFAAMTASKDLAKDLGSYKTFAGSPVCQPPINWTNSEKQFDCFVSNQSQR